jgi:cAMP-dependent protein kinase regulator
VPLFISLTDDELSVLAKRFKSEQFERGDEVVRAGDSGDSFYVVHSGRAEVLSASGESLNTLRRGDYFGEASLLSNVKRNATIRALTSLEVLTLSKYHFDRIVRTNVKFDDKAREEFHQIGVLRQIPLFEAFEGLELRLLARKLAKLEIAEGQTVFTQDEGGDQFYIVESGKVSVQIDGRERATLGAGEYFGEIALMMDVPRTATVTALQPTHLLQLSASDFNKLIQESTAMKQAIERASSRRVLSNERWARAGAGSQ